MTLLYTYRYRWLLIFTTLLSGADAFEDSQDKGAFFWIIALVGVVGIALVFLFVYMKYKKSDTPPEQSFISSSVRGGGVILGHRRAVRTDRGTIIITSTSHQTINMGSSSNSASVQPQSSTSQNAIQEPPPPYFKDPALPQYNTPTNGSASN